MKIKPTKRTRIYPNGNKYVGEFKDGEFLGNLK